MGKAIFHKADEEFGHWTIIKLAGRNKKGNLIWLCRCICGKEKTVPGWKLRIGRSKSCGCKKIRNQFGENNPNWKGGKTLHTKRYVYLYKPNHPNADKRGYVLEHYFVMSKHLGRPIKSDERIHHKNGIKSDNTIRNLELWVYHHPPGQRVKDLVTFSLHILQRYAPSKLK